MLEDQNNKCEQKERPRTREIKRSRHWKADCVGDSAQVDHEACEILAKGESQDVFLGCGDHARKRLGMIWKVNHGKMYML